jgi:hypothetical protein
LKIIKKILIVLVLNPSLFLAQTKIRLSSILSDLQEDCKGYWKVCDPENMRKFSSVGYVFGKKLQEDLKTPIGLIVSNWGVTPVETWTPKEKLIQNNEWVQSTKLLMVGNLFDKTGLSLAPFRTDNVRYNLEPKN